MERQTILTRDDPPMLWYVLDEGILHRVVGSAEVMDAQLERLIMAASAGGTVIQVLSFAPGDQPGADGPITVFGSRMPPRCAIRSVTEAAAWSKTSPRWPT